MDSLSSVVQAHNPVMLPLEFETKVNFSSQDFFFNYFEFSFYCKPLSSFVVGLNQIYFQLKFLNLTYLTNVFLCVIVLFFAAIKKVHSVKLR